MTLTTDLVAYLPLDDYNNDRFDTEKNMHMYFVDNPAREVARIGFGVRLNGTTQYGKIEQRRPFSYRDPYDNVFETWSATKLASDLAGPYGDGDITPSVWTCGFWCKSDTGYIGLPMPLIHPVNTEAAWDILIDQYDTGSETIGVPHFYYNDGTTEKSVRFYNADTMTLSSDTWYCVMFGIDLVNGEYVSLFGDENGNVYYTDSVQSLGTVSGLRGVATDWSVGDRYDLHLGHAYALNRSATLQLLSPFYGFGHTYFDGMFEGLGVWKNILTPAQLLEFYNEGMGTVVRSREIPVTTAETDIHAYWHLDQTAGWTTEADEYNARVLNNDGSVGSSSTAKFVNSSEFDGNTGKQLREDNDDFQMQGGLSGSFSDGDSEEFTVSFWTRFKNVPNTGAVVLASRWHSQSLGNGAQTLPSNDASLTSALEAAGFTDPRDMIPSDEWVIYYNSLTASICCIVNDVLAKNNGEDETNRMRPIFVQSPVTPIVADDWYHVVMTVRNNGYTGTHVRLIVDGVDYNSRSEAPLLLNGNGNNTDNDTLFGQGVDFWSATSSPHSPLDGYIDEIAMWNKELNRPEIEYMYNNGVGNPLNGNIIPLFMTVHADLNSNHALFVNGTNTPSLAHTLYLPSQFIGSGVNFATNAHAPMTGVVPLFLESHDTLTKNTNLYMKGFNTPSIEMPLYMKTQELQYHNAEVPLSIPSVPSETGVSGTISSMPLYMGSGNPEVNNAIPIYMHTVLKSTNYNSIPLSMRVKELHRITGNVSLFTTNYAESGSVPLYVRGEGDETSAGAVPFNNSMPLFINRPNETLSMPLFMKAVDDENTDAITLYMNGAFVSTGDVSLTTHGHQQHVQGGPDDPMTLYTWGF